MDGREGAKIEQTGMLMKYSFIILLIALFNSGCNKSGNSTVYTAEIICNGGCFPHAYYARITSNNIAGRTTNVYDTTGNLRGSFSHVVIINNLATADRTEGKKINFKNYAEPVASCQSSFPRIQFEIEIEY